MGRLLPKNNHNVVPPCTAAATGKKKIEVTKKAAGPTEKRKYHLQQPTLKLRKHPLAPKKPRSAFILFSQYMHNESSSLAEHFGEEKDEKDNKVPQAAKHISAVWKAMSAEERKKWVEKSDKDRLRYDVEKVIYKGKWTVTHAGKRSKKDKMAPKRPMSAFLDFSKTLRTKVIQANPQAKNNREISKILGNMWRNASAEDKKYFVENEARLRAEYNEKMSKWRKEKGDQLAEKLSMREAAVRDAIDHGTVDSLVKAAEVSQQTLFGIDSEAAFEAPAESNLQHSLPYGYSRYPSYHSPAVGHIHYQAELSSIPQSSVRYRQAPGCNISTISINSSYNSGYYDREKYSYEGSRTYQEQSMPHYIGRTVSSEQDPPRLSYGGWNCSQPTEGGRWENSSSAPHNSSNYSAKPNGYHHVPYHDEYRANFSHSLTARSSGGWSQNDNEWFSWD